MPEAPKEEEEVADEFDVIVVGMGVGGEEVAGRAADAGLDVLAVEKKLVGGECPYWGCIPSKIMLRAAYSLEESALVNRLAGHAESAPDWSPLARRVREATASWDDSAGIERHEEKGSTVVKGAAKMVGQDAVEVDGRRYRARKGIVLATGGEPSSPPIEGLDGVDYWTNREAIEATEPPRSMIVLGGGAIGVELSQVYAAFGTKITIVEMAPHVLPLEEPENSEALAEVLEAQGMTVIRGTGAERISTGTGGIEVMLGDGRSVTAEKLLVATGRRSDLRPLGLDAAGLDPEARSIEVDDHLRATPGVWAVGDVTGKGQFTHVAVYQGRVAAADILGEPHPPADYRALPRVTFTYPEVASIGLTEAQARDKEMDTRVGVAETASSARGWIHGPGAERGVMKLVADGSSGALVGASVMSPAAGEVIGLLLLAIKERVPTSRLRDLIYPYPTFVRGLEDALKQVG